MSPTNSSSLAEVSPPASASTCRLARAKRSRKGRGAIFVEAVLIFPVLLSFFGLMWSGHQILRTRLSKEAKTRANTFREAFFGCPATVSAASSDRVSAPKHASAEQGIRKPEMYRQTDQSLLELNDPLHAAFSFVTDNGKLYSNVYCNTIESPEDTPKETERNFFDFATQFYRDPF